MQSHKYYKYVIISTYKNDNQVVLGFTLTKIDLIRNMITNVTFNHTVPLKGKTVIILYIACISIINIILHLRCNEAI